MTRRTIDPGHQNASDLAAAINAIVLVSGFDDSTRAPLMAILDAAAGRVLPFDMADKYLGKRLPRCSVVSVEHGEQNAEDLSDRAFAKRWKRAWQVIDENQAEKEFCLVERRRGGLRGESGEKARRRPSTYRVPLVQIVVDVIRRAKKYKTLFGAKRVEQFQHAAKEVIDALPRDYKPQAPPMPREKSPKRTTTTETDGETTRIINSHLRLVKRAADAVMSHHLTEQETDSIRLRLIQQIEDSFDSLFTATDDRNGEACTTRSGNVLHAETPETPEVEPAEADIQEGNQAENPDSFSDAESVQCNFEKPNVYAGEKGTYVPTHGTLLTSEGDAPDMLSWALHYAFFGWKVFPLHTPTDAGGCSCRKPTCQNIGKHPRTMNGLKDATDDPEQIKRWWGMWKDANIGVATGKVSNLLAIDVDPRHDGWEGLRAWFERASAVFPPTLEAITGSDGSHYCFQMPDVDIRNSQNKLGQGVDVRANGGYIVASPSLHASGKRYQWATTEATLDHLPYPFLKDFITPERRHYSESTSEASPAWTGGTIPDGERNGTLWRHACAMRGRGASENEILDALCVMNRHCEKGGFDSRYLSDMAARAAEYPTNAKNIWSQVA